MNAGPPTRPPGGPSAGGSAGGGGYALAAALWILVLLGVLSATFVAAAQSERRAVANALEAARARWAARAGLARAAATLDRKLASMRAARELRSAGDVLVRTDSLRVNGVPVEAVLRDSRARLHLNRASRRELVDLMEALDIGRSRGGRLAAAVLDWRDADDRRRPGGAEARDYAAMGLPARPRDAPLASVAELRRVRGTGGDVWARMRPFVTVVGDGRINVNSAPAPVLATLPFLGRSSARALVENRTEGPYGSAFEVARALPEDVARRVREHMEAFEGRIAFGPRFGQVVARARPPGSRTSVELRADVELEGGSGWRILRIRER